MCRPSNKILLTVKKKTHHFGQKPLRNCVIKKSADGLFTNIKTLKLCENAFIRFSTSKFGKPNLGYFLLEFTVVLFRGYQKSTQFLKMRDMGSYYEMSYVKRCQTYVK